MGFPKDYAKPMYDKFGFNVIWPPNARVEIGDYGTVKKKKGKAESSFEKVGNVKDHFPKAKFTVESSARADVEMLEAEGVSMAEGKGEAGDPERAVKVTIGFKKKNSFVYQGSKMVLKRIKDPTAFGKALYKEKNWNKKWLVVSEIHETEAMTLLLCEQRDSSATIMGNKNLTAGNTAALEAHARVTSHSSAVANYSIHETSTPLLRARKVNKKGLEVDVGDDPDGVVMVLAERSIPLDEDTAFVEVTFDYCDIESDESDGASRG